MSLLFAFFSEMTFYGQPIWVWLFFAGVVTFILVLDLGILEKESKELSHKKSLLLFTLYVGIACLFGLWIWSYFGNEFGQAYFTTYLIELGLSVDNVMMMSLIFIYLNIPPKFQHRVLIWGILGAFFLRGAMILIGAEILERYSYVLLLFGIFLIYSGIKVIIDRSNEDAEASESKLLVFFRKIFNVSDTLEGQKFFIKKETDKDPTKKVWHITPLFLALLLIEFGDVMFAVDSLPAVFAVTYDPFIIFTSNLFAVLGLRALYFILLAALQRFFYIQHAMALILVIAGIKVFVDKFIFQMPDTISLGITFGLIIMGIAASMLRNKVVKQPVEQPQQEQQQEEVDR